MDILSNFAENFSELIFESKITIDDFSQKLNINLSEIYRYKRKEYLPSTSNILKIADFFHCSIDELLGFTALSQNLNYRVTQPFKDTFKQILEQRGFTRYKFCKESNIAPSSVDDWYHGKRLPSVDNLIKLRKFFDCTIDYLFGRE